MDKKKAALLSIFSNSLLIIFKLIAGIFMNSISVISEAIHSSIDLLASLIAFASIKKASEAEDEDHPFGHGKYENVSGFVEAILILFAAIIIIYEAANKIIHGSSIGNPESGIIVMFVSSLVNLIISLILLKIAKATNSIALEADAMHLLTDVFTSAGVLVGLIILKFTGIKLVDPITAIVVAVLIIKTGVELIRKSMIDLVDGSLPKEDIDKILSVVKSHTEVITYHKLRTRRCGSKREIDIHLKLNEDFSLVQAHDLCSCIEKEINIILPDSYVTIHAEPYKKTIYGS